MFLICLLTLGLLMAGSIKMVVGEDIMIETMVINLKIFVISTIVIIVTIIIIIKFTIIIATAVITIENASFNSQP